MDRLIRNGRILWRAQSIVADIRLRQLITRIGLRTAAVAVGLFGFMMGNLAVFFGVEQALGPVWAAGLIAAANVTLSVALFLAAARAIEGRELELALDVRNLALQEIESEAQALQAQIAELRNDVRGMKQSLGTFIRHPIDTALPQLLVPLAGAVIKGMRKSGAAAS
jgi:hypothetical protein